MKIQMTHSSDAHPLLYKAEDEIDLRKLMLTLWSGKWIVLVALLLTSGAGVIYSLSLPDIYRSEVLLAPTEDSNSGGMGMLAGQLGGLASLAGVSLSKGQASKTVIALEVLKSRAFISDFIKRRDILIPLMAGGKWDSANGQLSVDESKYDAKMEQWIGRDSKPSDWQTYKVFSQSLKVDQSKDSGLVVLAFEHLSPVIAQQWVAWLVEDINSFMRQRDIEEATKSIDYLKQQLTQTSLAGMQQIFYQLIEKQMQIIMLANVRTQYVFKVIDPPIIPEQRAEPKRLVIVLLAAVFGFFASLIGVLLVDFLRKP